MLEAYARIATGALCLVAGSGLMAEEEQAIEEMIVTGSYIKRENFDLASPMAVIDQEELKAQATPALGEVIGNLPFSYGADLFTNRYTARFQSGTFSAANLRGLGANATLTLIDDRRTFSNLNNVLPQIAIERVDILKDGASAIYGTDAVAGVINFITRLDFEGMRASGMFQSDGDGDTDEYVLNLIGGKAFDWGHATLAIEYRDRSKLDQIDRGRYLRNGFSSSGDGNPGSYQVPVRDAQGQLSGVEFLRDPGCGVAASPGGNGGLKSESLGNRRNNISGTPAFTGPRPICQFQYGEFFQFIEEQEAWNIWSNIEYRLSDSLTLETSLIYNRQDVTATQSPTGPGGRFTELAPVVGEHPGNPFRAYSDLNGNGVIDDGERLFAQDGNNDGLPDRDLDNAVILAADPFDPSSGIAFNEDVTITGLRLYGKLGTLPSSFASNGGGKTGPTRDNIRTQATLNWDIDGNWYAQLNAVYSYGEFEAPRTEQSFSITEQALRGELEADDGTRLWYNPFSTVALTCLDRICEDDPSGAFDNTQAVADAMVYRGNAITTVEFHQTRLLLIGDLPWRFPGGGALGSAWGLELGGVEWKDDLGASLNGCDDWVQECRFDYRADANSWSVFGELVFPILEQHDLLGNFELQLAARYSDVEDADDDLVPKVAALWQPTSWLSLRGSYSQAFITPTIPQRFAPASAFATTTTDPLFLDAQATFKQATFNSNPDLESETADVWNLGVSFLLFDGRLGLGADYAVYDFKDRISSTTPQQIIDEDFTNFQAAFPNPTAEDRFAWGCGGLANPAIVRPQCDLGITTISNVQTSWINAQEMEHRAVDLYVTLLQGLGDWGSLDLRVDATYVDEYSYFLGPGIPAGDGVGQQNDTVAEIPPTPEWRINGVLNYFIGNHNVRLGARWSDEVELDAAFFGNSVANGDFFDVCPEGSLGGLGEGCDIEDLLYIDLAYSYRWDSLWGDRSTTIEIGGRNITDETPEPRFFLSGIETYLHDPRGALWYLRLTQDL